MQLSREQLLCDLRQAYYDARRHKRNQHYQRVFEANLDENLSALCDDLYNRTYKTGRSTCFLVKDPKLREVFAAQFRDRIVHPLYYNYTHKMLERTFIADSYSCIKGRGTHYGIDRLEQHIRQVSENWKQPCYVLKLDIKGYFMHINRNLLLMIVMRQLKKLSRRRVEINSSYRWRDIVDFNFLRWLSKEIILLDPTVECRMLGRPEEWEKLPHSKSLFHSPYGCGLPIGNLTSQLFSNVYLNEMDQYMKRELGCKHYGRYVDDFFVVSNDKSWLRELVPKIQKFLKDKLSLQLQEGKVRIHDVNYGLDFLGAYLKPYRRYVSNSTLRRMNGKFLLIKQECDIGRLCCRANSLLGVLSHYRSLRFQRQLIRSLHIPQIIIHYLYDGKKYRLLK